MDALEGLTPPSDPDLLVGVDVVSVVPAAFLGANISKKIPVDTLRIILGICIALAAFRVGFAALGQ